MHGVNVARVKGLQNCLCCLTLLVEPRVDVWLLGHGMAERIEIGLQGVNGKCLVEQLDYCDEHEREFE